jgi:hypothetical protein
MSKSRGARRQYSTDGVDDSIDEIEDLSGEEDRKMNNSNPPTYTDGYGRW